MATRPVTRECSSLDGEWSIPGEDANVCPACGEDMPYDNGPLRSDHAIRSVDAQRSAQAQMGDLPARLWSYQRQHKKAA